MNVCIIVYAQTYLRVDPIRCATEIGAPDKWKYAALKIILNQFSYSNVYLGIRYLLHFEIRDNLLSVKQQLQRLV